ncbi:MAG: V-type ATP synthase subunit E family protein [Oscillospiraceae bacterium]
MDGINKITDRIAAETREEISALQAETAEKCRVIKEEYDKIAQEEYTKLLRAGVTECELQVQRLGSTAAMEAKKTVLAMKQNAVGQVFDVAIDRISDLPTEQYTSFLARLASTAASNGTEEIIFNERDKATCAKAVTKEANDLLKQRGLLPKLTISEITGTFKGGLMLKQGNIEVNCCVEKLVELSRSELSSQIADVLFTD